MAGSQTPIALTGGTDVTDVDFGYQTEFITTPITLGYFHVKSLGGGSVEISWQTVTEVAHLGFNLYVRETVQGESERRWRRLNAELIAPAGPGDSFDTREYTFTAYSVSGKRFALGDVDVTGKETIHGPFKLDRKAGADRAARSVTDWDAIQAKRAGKKAAREARRKAKAQKRLHKQLQKSKAEGVRNVTKPGRVPLKRATAPEPINQSSNPDTSQEDKEFEMLELDNERCELEDCAYNDGDELSGRGLSPATGGDTGVGSPSLASRVVAGVLALLVPNAYAAEPAADTGVAQIETTEAGIYKVTYDDLLELGVDIRDVYHWRLSLTNGGEPVYIRTWGQHASNGDRRYFGPGGGIEFVAEAHRTLYSKSNVYTLHLNAPERLPQADPAGLHGLTDATGSVVDYYQETTQLEPEEAYSTLSPNGDPWFGFQVKSSGADKTIFIPLSCR